MLLKNKIINILTTQPRLVTFGIGLAITFVIGAAMGMMDNLQAFASGSGSTIRDT